MHVSPRVFMESPPFKGRKKRYNKIDVVHYESYSII